TVGSVYHGLVAHFDLLKKDHNITEEKGLTTHVGNVFTSDIFYRDNGEAFNQLLMDHRVLGVEMETTAVYTLAAKFNRQALSILTVSDHIITGEATTSEERQTSFHQMMELALETVIQ